jgi:hypothetical protein
LEDSNENAPYIIAIEKLSDPKHPSQREQPEWAGGAASGIYQ